MNRFFSVTLFLPVIFFFALIFALISYNMQAVNEMQEIMLRDAADAANDAAIWQAQHDANMNEYGNSSISPDAAWKTYKFVFLTAMGLYSTRNMELFEAYCPATIIAVNDGYYMRMRMLVFSEEAGVYLTEYRFSQKIPYARYLPERNLVIADTMNGAELRGFSTVTPDAGALYAWNTEEVSAASVAGLHDPVGVASEILRAVDYSLRIEASSRTHNLFDTRQFYVPSALGDKVTYQATTFKGLTILNLIQGFDMKSTTQMDYFTVSNSQLVRSGGYACYTVDGRKLYSPLGRETSVISSADMSWIDAVMPTREAAASLGYRPDSRFY